MAIATINDKSFIEWEQPTADQPDKITIRFSSGHVLLADAGANEIKLVNEHQEVQLQIAVGQQGLAVNISAPSKLQLQAADEIQLSSKKIVMEASEQLHLKSGGNMVTEVSKDVLTEVAGQHKIKARDQAIIASPGAVNIKANDDVNLDGERVLLNCT